MPTTVTIVPHQGRTALAVDGQVIPGMSYFSYMYQRGEIHTRYFQEMVDAGIRVFFCPWYIDVSAYYNDPRAVTWAPDGSLNFGLIDDWMGALSGVSDELWYMLRLYLATPPWWADRYPEELVRYAGSDALSSPVTRAFPYTRQASMASERWRDDMTEVLQRLVAHVEQGPHADESARNIRPRRVASSRQARAGVCRRAQQTALLRQAFASTTATTRIGKPILAIGS